ncbi:response regulator [Azohydromonas lata]|uniref:Two-component system response regulator n=1 Tax=Azohydromonas lata TaxID=45677 RepID=A0ABU5IS03_9BURK|nr:two-component system response regulator [Azohydromonas lata]MDZ5461678.1 two-component system response regulator [Azohydromonas lata]
MTISSQPAMTPEESAKPTVLVVDDTPQNLKLLGDLLQPTYRVRATTAGESALRAVQAARPDLILLDVMMPGMDGYEVLRRLQADPATRDIPVIFITALDGADSERKGLAEGAVDYITKPIDPAVTLARVRTHVELKRTRDQLAHHNRRLEQEVARRLRQNLLIQDLSLRALACLGEARDSETGHHIVRTQAYVELLARRLRDHPRFASALQGQRLDMVVQAAPLHDIGKVGIADAVLLKPGKLTPKEFELMKAHAAIGADAIAKAMQGALASVSDAAAHEMAGEAFAFLQAAREIAQHHHEKWDGSGYPRGLAGEDIPVSARLMALADVFDALVSRRVYKPPMSLEETTRIIVEGSGRHFDPDVVDAFLACREEFAAVAGRVADPQSAPAPAVAQAAAQAGQTVTQTADSGT